MPILQKLKYRGLHARVERNLPKPKDGKCPKCHMKKKLEVSAKSGRQRQVLKDWEWLCRSCNNKSTTPRINSRFKEKQYDGR